MSSALLWELVRGQNAFLVKRNGVALSREPGNLTNRHSPKYSGLVHDRGVDLRSVPGGVVLSLKQSRRRQRPAKAFSRQTLNRLDLKRDFHHVATVVKNGVKQTHRRGLNQAALARWSLLHRSLAGANAKRPANRITQKKKRPSKRTPPAIINRGKNEGKKESKK